MLPTITAVTQQAECSTFNRMVRGSIPLSGIAEGIQLMEQKQIWFKPFFRSIISVVKNARLIFFKVSVRHQFDSGMEHLEGDTAQGAFFRCSVGGYHTRFSLS